MELLLQSPVEFLNFSLKSHQVTRKSNFRSRKVDFSEDFPGPQSRPPRIEYFTFQSNPISSQRWFTLVNNCICSLSKNNPLLIRFLFTKSWNSFIMTACPLSPDGLTDFNKIFSTIYSWQWSIPINTFFWCCNIYHWEVWRWYPNICRQGESFRDIFLKINWYLLWLVLYDHFWLSRNDRECDDPWTGSVLPITGYELAITSSLIGRPRGRRGLRTGECNEELLSLSTVERLFTVFVTNECVTTYCNIPLKYWPVIYLALGVAF